MSTKKDAPAIIAGDVEMSARGIVASVLHRIALQVRFGWCVLLIGVVAGCTGGSSNSVMRPASFTSVAGDYSGTSQDSKIGTGAFSLAISQSGSSLSGSWGAGYGSGLESGTISGTVSNNVVSATLSSAVHSGCSATLTAVLSHGTLTGSYGPASSGCSITNGTFSASLFDLPAIGSYVGPVNDSLSGSGTLSFTFTQNGVALIGSWSDTFSNTSSNTTGTAYGVVTGSSVELYAVPSSSSACPLIAAGKLIGTAISGAYSAIGCSVSQTGTFSLAQVLSQAAVVPCSQIGELRSLGTSLSYVTNPKTGDKMEYTIIGDAALGNDVLVMFPGTGQILTGWPVQMLTNSTYSPNITGDLTYDPLEDGSISLCHDYHIALFDYPGVGNTPLNGNVTRDMIASDVDAMLTDAATKYQISTSVVDPIGWSLGTQNTLKFAALSPVSRPSRTIHNVVLIAAGGGGSLQGQIGNNSAACVTTMFGASLTASGSLLDQLELALSELIFPYLGQTQSQNGTNSGCTAAVSASTLSLSVTPDCGVINHCIGYLASSVVDLNTYPWSITKGIDAANYAQERELSNDFDAAYCSGAGANFTSTGCVSYGAVQMSVQNGGVCQTNTSNPDAPVMSACDPLAMTGKLTVFDGYEDLLTQYTYDQALVTAYGGSATVQLYPGSAGHGLMIQHPQWTQREIFAALQ